jgi:hypothetical protein
MRSTSCLSVIFSCALVVQAFGDEAVYVPEMAKIQLTASKASTSSGSITGGLYAVGSEGQILVRSYAAGSFVPAGERVLEVVAPQLDADKQYQLKVYEYPTANGNLFLDVSVVRMLVPTIGTTAQCPNAIQIGLKAPNTGPPAAKNAAIDAVYDWAERLSHGSVIAKGILKTEDGKAQTIQFTRLATAPREVARARADGQVFVCLGPRSRLPVDGGNLSIQLLQNPPMFISGPIKGKFTGEKAIDFSNSDKNPGERTLMNNLDLAISYKTSVKTDTKTNVRSRSQDGVFDVRIAPWLNLLQVPVHVGNTLRYFTPISVDAKVSTGPITKDTLSVNRVVFGSEYEWRIIPDTGRNTMHRFVLTGQHLSDRDFKQLEYTGGVQYKLMVDPFFKPLKLRQRTSSSAWFGWQVTPSLEFDLGRTYERRNPAPAILPSDTVRRFGNELDIKLDFTKYVVAEFDDQYFIRGEDVNTDLFHNHFEAKLNLPLSRPFTNAGHSLVLSFERGNLPPFATPDVNVFKVGYKFSSTSWFGQSR